MQAFLQRHQLVILYVHVYIHNMFKKAVWLVYSYIFVKEMGEEDDQEELDCRVNPYVSSCHCIQFKVPIYIMASSDF